MKKLITLKKGCEDVAVDGFSINSAEPSLTADLTKAQIEALEATEQVIIEKPSKKKDG